MHGQLSEKIIEHFTTYTDILSNDKTIIQTEITLEPRPNGPWRTSIVPLSHPNISGIDLNVGFAIRSGKYGFRIFFKEICPEPIFNFDSDGPKHYNYIEELPIKKQSIPTPHFNYYDKNGRKLAKRTAFIDENESDIKSDINVGMSHFCQEARILSIEGKVPTVIPEPQIPLFLPTDQLPLLNFEFE